MAIPSEARDFWLLFLWISSSSGAYFDFKSFPLKSGNLSGFTLFIATSFPPKSKVWLGWVIGPFLSLTVRESFAVSLEGDAEALDSASY